MKLRRDPISVLVRTLTLAASATAFSAWADIYGDVGQLIRSGQLAAAQSKADQHLAGKPRDPQMRYLKALIQRDLGQADDALATFRQLSEEFPELPEPHNGMAVVLAAQGKYEPARAALETAVRLNPAYAAAQENLGDIYTALARQAYCRAAQLEPAGTTIKPKLAMINAQCP